MGETSRAWHAASQVSGMIATLHRTCPRQATPTLATFEAEACCHFTHADVTHAIITRSGHQQQIMPHHTCPGPKPHHSLRGRRLCPLPAASAHQRARCTGARACCCRCWCRHLSQDRQVGAMQGRTMYPSGLDSAGMLPSLGSTCPG